MRKGQRRQKKKRLKKKIPPKSSLLAKTPKRFGMMNQFIETGQLCETDLPHLHRDLCVNVFALQATLHFLQRMFECSETSARAEDMGHQETEWEKWINVGRKQEASRMQNMVAHTRNVINWCLELDVGTTPP